MKNFKSLAVEAAALADKLGSGSDALQRVAKKYRLSDDEVKQLADECAICYADF